MSHDPSSKNKRTWIIIAVVAFVLLLLLLLFLIKPASKTYEVNFYEDDNHLGRYVLDEDKRIDQTILDEVLSKVFLDNVTYLYEWSHQKDVLDKVDFELVNTDSDIYLYKTYKQEFKITVEESDLFDYEIIADDRLTPNSTAKIKIEHKIDVDNYKVRVFANNIELVKNANDEYVIYNINSDIHVTVQYLEILSIKNLLLDSYKYNGTALEAQYQVVNSNDQVVNLNPEEIKVTLLNSDNVEILSAVEPGTYTIKYQYLGKEYYIEDVSCQVTIVKDTLTIQDLLKDSYMYSGKPLVPNYQVIDENGQVIDLGTDLVITILDEDGNKVTSMVKAGTYTITYHYTGNGYYVDDLVKEVTINRQKLSFKISAEDSYTYDGEEIEFDYQILDSQGNVVNIKDREIKVSYYDENNNKVRRIIDAGKYKMVFQYVGEEYEIVDAEKMVTVEKIDPIILVQEPVFKYDGKVHRLDKTYIYTNSDGLVFITNNAHSEVGRYAVTIQIMATNNYNDITTIAYMTIENGGLVILKDPVTSIGYENHYLNEITITDYLTNIKGHFEWKDPNTKLMVGNVEYDAIFIPDDLETFEKQEMKISVLTLSHEEMLEDVKENRQIILDTLIDKFSNQVTKDELLELIDLPISIGAYDTRITWYSTSTVLMVDDLGEMSILNSIGTHEIKLVAIIALGDAVEYLTFDFELEIKPDIDELENISVETTFVSLDNQNRDVEFENDEVTIINRLDNESYQNKDDKTHQRKELVNANEPKVINNSDQSVMTDYENISEVIVWKILTNSAGDGEFNTQQYTTNNLNINILSKGEQNV